MARPFTHGLHDLGKGGYAWLQPDGGWGLSNAGLVTDGSEALLVDTLVDLPRTRAMLEAMRAAVPAAERIGTVVNTHAHPDHTAGNSLLPEAQVVASATAAEEMRQIEAGADPFGRILRDWRAHGEAGAYLHEVLGAPFELHAAAQRMPDRTFETELSLRVGAKEVRLAKLGPAHTRGDVLVHVPADRMAFTGDLLFHEVHPAVGAESVSDWIAACERMLAWDLDCVVPGHGPITDLSGVRGLKVYLEYFRAEARARFDSGMPLEDAARDLSFDAFRGWADEERIVITLASLYREFGAKAQTLAQTLTLAYRYRKDRNFKRRSP